MVLDLEARQREVCSVEAESGPGTAVGCSSFNRGGNHEAYCIVRGLRINPKPAVAYALQPGVANPHKAGVQPPELTLEATRAFSAMPAACASKMPPAGLGGQRFLDNVLAAGTATTLSACTLTIRDPVLFVADKYGEVNPWHSMEDTTHAFTLLSLARFPVATTRVILVDRPQRGPNPSAYMGMWDFVWEVLSGGAPVTSLGKLLLNATELASAVDTSAVTDPELRAVLEAPDSVSSEQMQRVWDGRDDRTVCFTKSTYSLHGGMSMLSAARSPGARGPCVGSPLLLGLSDLVLTRLPGGTAVPPSHSAPDRAGRTLQILLLTRGGSRTVSQRRKLQHPDALRAQLSKIPGTTTTMESFDDKPKLEQLRLIRAADILVSVHGAGLTWTLFLPAAAAVVEMVAGTPPCSCFSDLAGWTDHPFRSLKVNLQGTQFPGVIAAVEAVAATVHDRIDAWHR